MATGPNPSKHRETAQFVDDEFPNLRSADIDWDDASDPTDDYNCMGMAVGVLRWWSPPNAPGVAPNPRDYWPPAVTNDQITVAAFMEAAATVGFSRCPSADWEEGYEKIVFFHDRIEFKHAAVQVAPERWKSKFGNLSDFEHTLEQLVGITFYGDEQKYMKRRK
jgi:hypothetical protein